MLNPQHTFDDASDLTIVNCEPKALEGTHAAINQVYERVSLTSALELAIAFESGLTLAQEMAGQVAAFGVGHTSSRDRRIRAFVYVCKKEKE